MKAIKLASGMLVAAALLFTACDSDRDYNPVLDEGNLPKSFTLNTPAYSTQTIDLAHSTALHFSWSQPAYGFPAVTTYKLQMSLTNTWDDAQYDANGVETKAATYYNLSGSTNAVSTDVEAKDFDKGVATLAEWVDESSVSADPYTAYVRCVATTNDGGNKVISNSVPVKVKAYYVSVVNYPKPWFFTGAGIQGGWNGGYNDCVPFDLSKDATYDADSWAGTYTKTLWLKAGDDYGFKLVSVLGDWTNQIGGSFDAPAYNNGGASNLVAPADGYYTFTLESNGIDGSKAKLTVKAANIDEATYPVHKSMKISGSALEAPVEMTPMLVNGHNHVWHATINTVKGGLVFTDDAGKVYSDTKFPYGWATAENGVIPVVKGTLEVYFDDLSGCYEFFAQ